MNSLYYIQDGEFYEVKADKKSIGGQSYVEESIRIFTKQTIDFSKASSFVLYMCSDGYQDQFGGTKGRKFMTKNLKILLTQIASKPLKEQQEILDNTLLSWMGRKDEQTDDITVMGIKLK
jgi:serine phosphatase RsbU (regulator of sigma subunit)